MVFLDLASGSNLYLTADHILVSAFYGGRVLVRGCECTDTDCSFAAYMQSAFLQLC